MLAFMGTTNEFTRIAKQKPVHVTTIIAAVTILLPKELDKHAFADARNAGDNAFNSIVYNTGSLQVHREYGWPSRLEFP
jgi:hypothetical protein